jgi:hypothetical protein
MGRSILGNRRSGVVWAALAALALLTASSSARAYTTESREVRQAVDRAVKFLRANYRDEGRPGGAALVGIVLLKMGVSPSDPVVTSIAAFLERQANGAADPAKSGLDIYSTSLVIIFFAILDPIRYSGEIDLMLRYLESKQKAHGGWGYDIRKTGDTSMTQNAVLSFYELTKSDYRVPTAMMDRALVWLLKTQDRSGGFGYQGITSDDFTPVQQSQVKPSMSGAGLGSIYILAELLNVGKAPKKEGSGLPPALKEVGRKKEAPPRSRVNPELVHMALARGKAWMAEKFVIKQHDYHYYNLYTVERYHTFREIAEGNEEKEPRWYNEGVNFLLETQNTDGSWKGHCGLVPSTAFGVLFLIRSTRISVREKRSFGDGTLVGGKGLPTHTAGLTVRQGKVVAKMELGSLDQMLDALADSEEIDYDAALGALPELPTEALEPLVSKHAKMLQALAGDESPHARLVAVRALGRQRNLDNVPILIYALTDPEPVIMQEARDGLRRISRKFQGFGLPDNPTKPQLFSAKRKWQDWFLSIRPDAKFED